jgi:hypothetical protein
MEKDMTVADVDHPGDSLGRRFACYLGNTYDAGKTLNGATMPSTRDPARCADLGDPGPYPAASNPRLSADLSVH